MRRLLRQLQTDIWQLMISDRMIVNRMISKISKRIISNKIIPDKE